MLLLLLLLLFFYSKYSLEQRGLDDPDEDINTVYRGLAVPVDIRQVVEVKRKKATNLLNILNYSHSTVVGWLQFEL